jgi:hypothetical protein
VGDATPLGGPSISRILNALCYIIAGVASFVLAAQPGVGRGWPIVFGIGGVLYGLKILFTRSSYWVSSFVYVVAILAVSWAIGAVSQSS